MNELFANIPKIPSASSGWIYWDHGNNKTNSIPVFLHINGPRSDTELADLRLAIAQRSTSGHYACWHRNTEGDGQDRERYVIRGPSDLALLIPLYRLPELLIAINDMARSKQYRVEPIRFAIVEEKGTDARKPIV